MAADPASQPRLRCSPLAPLQRCELGCEAKPRPGASGPTATRLRNEASSLWLRWKGMAMAPPPEVMPAGRTPPSEVNFLFACFAQCSPKNLRAEELQLFPREFHTFCQKPVPGRAAAVVTGALGPGGSPSLRLPRRMSPLRRTSRSGQVNFCCVEMAKSVETTTCLKS